MAKEIVYGQKKSIREVVVANPRLYKEVAGLMKVDKKEVQDIVEHIGKFIAGVISEGTMHTVMLPYFGKFKPHKKFIQATRKRKMNEANGKDILYRAMHGMDIIDKRKPKQ